jgi:hypothetical protein
VLLHGNAERNQFSNLLTKILPGRTQAEIKWSLPSKDCNSFKEAFFFLNQDSTNIEIFKILSAVTIFTYSHQVLHKQISSMSS